MGGTTPVLDLELNNIECLLPGPQFSCFDVCIHDFVLYRLPVAERRGYTSVFNALSRIAREEGITTLWRVSAH